ncbi:MAG: adenosine deaminase [Chthonomonadaceae bacterium]|nr:adenosine deaminase [Chthonomonadaceae bacterium]
MNGLRNFVCQMPKVELHVHIEGSIQPSTVLKLAQKNGAELPSDTEAGLRDWYAFKDFPHFVEVYVAVSKCIQSPEDVELIVREFLENQASQNVLHSEATYTASTLEKHCGIPIDEQMDAVQRAMAYGERELGVNLGLILDIVRGDSLDRAFEVYGWVKDYSRKGVVALGLAGIERLGTLQYKPVFETAYREGVTAVCHAGETQGPETIWDVLSFESCVRIGHGVRCTEDPALMAHLAKSQTPLEVCPTSNVCIGVFPSHEAHPIRQMWDAGLNVTVNSDDPPMFGTSINEEWGHCVDTFEFSLEEIKAMNVNAVKASFASDERKRDILDRIDRHTDLASKV